MPSLIEWASKPLSFESTFQSNAFSAHEDHLVQVGQSAKFGQFDENLGELLRLVVFHGLQAFEELFHVTHVIKDSLPVFVESRLDELCK